jgi:hypothetical protein
MSDVTTLDDLVLDFTGTPIQGPEGPQGEKGDKGDAGTNGKDGTNGTNGADGQDGQDGNTGATGQSAYQLWLANGNVGSVDDFLASLKGEDGDSAYQTWLNAGNSGTLSDFLATLKGPKGDAGAAGTNGTNGTNGRDGTNGTNGVDGKDGADGADGAKGEKGDPGEKGDKGDAGTGLTNRGNWASGVTYSPSDYVFAANAAGNTSMWIQSGDTDYVSTIAPKSDTAHWIEFQAPAGAAGADGKSVELQKTATAIQWRVVGGTWADLVLLSAIKGDKGDTGTAGTNGTNGSNGVGIASTVTTYQAAASGTVTPTGAWSSTVPAVTKGQFLWTRTIFTLSDASTATAYTVAYQGADGAKGDTGTAGTAGTNGSNGVGIASSAVTYQTAASGTTAPTSTWTSAVPAITKGQYLWTRTVLTLSDASTVTIYSVAYQGADGSAGTGGSGSTWLSGTSDPTSATGADGNWYLNTSSTVVFYRASGAWASVGAMPPIATTAQAQAATSNLVLMTPAKVREYLEQFGLTATYTTTVADLNTAVKGQFFNYSNTTTNIPTASTYGRGITLPAGDGYVTQIAVENDTAKMYVRYQSGASTWSAWTQIGASSGGSASVMGASGTTHAAGLAPDPGATAGTTKFLREDATWAVPPAGSGGGSATPCVYQGADKTINSSSTTALGMKLGTIPLVGVLYRVTGLLVTQGDAAGTIAITVLNEGANGFRLTAKAANSAGTVIASTTTQDSVAMTVPLGAQDSTVSIEGFALFSYVGPTGPDLSVKLASGSWCNILKGSHLVFTPLGTMTTIA